MPVYPECEWDHANARRPVEEAEPNRCSANEADEIIGPNEANEVNEQMENEEANESKSKEARKNIERKENVKWICK